MRTHHEFGAYCIAIPAPSNAKLFSLKVETLRMGGAQRRFVDAVLLDGDRISVVPFIRVCSGGSLVLQETYANLPGDLVAALTRQSATWLEHKGGEAQLDATLFLRDPDLESALAASEVNGRALPGLVPYQNLFDEAERYANLSPYIRGKHVLDLNGGFGYGVCTLRQVAASVAFAGDTSPVVARMWQPGEDRVHDVAVHLNVAGEAGAVLDRLREAAPRASTLLISIKGPGAGAVLKSIGAEPVKMRRPGCDALGELDETLGIVGPRAALLAVPDLDEPRSPAVVSPRPLRVLFALRPSSTTAFGGDVVQVNQTAKALQSRGHHVVVSTSARLSPEGYDVVHLSNLTSAQESLMQAQSVAAFPGAVTMMPIYIDHADETIWGMTTTLGVFLSSENDEDLAQKLQALEQRAVSAAGVQAPPIRTELVPNYESMQRQILRCVDYLVLNAHAEANRIYRHLDCEIPYAVAPSAADPRTYGSFARTAFEAKYGFTDFVLIAGRYEPRKNQLLLFEAIRDLGYPLVCVGSNAEAPVAHALRAYRPGNAGYIGFLPERELAGAFAAARVVAVPSWDEVVSLTSLNAAISEASLVLSRNGYEHEYFGDDGQYCDPGSVASLRRSLQRAWESHEARAARRKELAQRVARDFTWERSAQLTEEAYYRLLAYNPRRERRINGWT